MARQVAEAIGASFNVLISRTIGVPGIEELAFAAISEGSDCVVADPLAWYIGVPPAIVDRLASREQVELARRCIGKGRPFPSRCRVRSTPSRLRMKASNR